MSGNHPARVMRARPPERHDPPVANLVAIAYDDVDQAQMKLHQPSMAGVGAASGALEQEAALQEALDRRGAPA